MLEKFTQVNKLPMLSNESVERYRVFSHTLRHYKSGSSQPLPDYRLVEVFKSLCEAEKNLHKPHAIFAMTVADNTCTKDIARDYIIALFNYCTASCSRIDCFDHIADATGIGKQLWIEMMLGNLLSNALYNRMLEELLALSIYVRSTVHHEFKARF